MPSGSRPQDYPLPVAVSACRESILDMINFPPPGALITARRVLENVLQSRRVYQSRGRRSKTTTS
jgi:hypothetical protein